MSWGESYLNLIHVKGAIQMKFIDYNSLKEFYTIQEACELFEMKKDDLREKCGQCSVTPN